MKWRIHRKEEVTVGVDVESIAEEKLERLREERERAESEIEILRDIAKSKGFM